MADTGKSYEVQTILYPTSEYTPGELTNDLALIQTKEPVGGSTQLLPNDVPSEQLSKLGLGECDDSIGTDPTGLWCSQLAGWRSGHTTKVDRFPVAIVVAATDTQTIYTPVHPHRLWINDQISHDQQRSTLPILAVAFIGIIAVSYLTITYSINRRRLQKLTSSP